MQTIAATTTRTGLRVRAELDTGACDTGIKVSDRQMGALPLTRHDWHGDWNYTLRPEDYDQAAGRPRSVPTSPALTWPGWRHPARTGLSAREWDALITTLMTLHDQRREADLDKRRGHRPRLGRPGRRAPPRPDPGRPAPGHRPRPAPRATAGRRCGLVHRPARDDQQAHSGDASAISWTRPYTNPARPEPARQPRRALQPRGNAVPLPFQQRSRQRVNHLQALSQRHERSINHGYCRSSKSAAQQLHRPRSVRFPS